MRRIGEIHTESCDALLASGGDEFSRGCRLQSEESIVKLRAWNAIPESFRRRSRACEAMLRYARKGLVPALAATPGHRKRENLRASRFAFRRRLQIRKRSCGRTGARGRGSRGRSERVPRARPPRSGPAPTPQRYVSAIPARFPY